MQFLICVPLTIDVLISVPVPLPLILNPAQSSTTLLVLILKQVLFAVRFAYNVVFVLRTCPHTGHSIELYPVKLVTLKLNILFVKPRFVHLFD